MLHSLCHPHKRRGREGKSRTEIVWPQNKINDIMFSEHFWFNLILPNMMLTQFQTQFQDYFYSSMHWTIEQQSYYKIEITKSLFCILGRIWMFRLHIAVSAFVILGGFSPKQSSLTRRFLIHRKMKERCGQVWLGQGAHQISIPNFFLCISVFKTWIFDIQVYIKF